MYKALLNSIRQEGHKQETSKRKIQRTGKIISWHLTSIIIKEIPMMCHFSPISRTEGLFFFYFDKPSIFQKLKSGYIQPWWDSKWHLPLESHQVTGHSICVPILQAVPLLRMHPEDSTLMFMKKVMFYASAFILSMIHKGKLQNSMYKLQSFHIMEYQSARKQNKFMIQTKTWINIQNIMLTGRGLIQKYILDESMYVKL